MRKYTTIPLMDRFWPKVNKTESCWVWTAKKTKGYGQISTRRCVHEYAHRISWMVHFGDPGKLHVLHHCDNPLCVRPDHLFLGTIADNNRDARLKMRHAFGDRHGSRTHPECFLGGAHGRRTAHA